MRIQLIFITFYCVLCVYREAKLKGHKNDILEVTFYKCVKTSVTEPFYLGGSIKLIEAVFGT